MILRTKRVPMDSIKPHPKNARRGNVAAIRESLSAHGQYSPLVVQESTGFIIKGNHTWEAMSAEGFDKATVVMLDVDDDRAERIMLADNRSSDHSVYDEEALALLLRDLADTPSGLEGTGFGEDELSRMLDDLLDDEEAEAPDEFPSIDPDSLETHYECPSCHYEWSGSPRPGVPLHEPES